MRSASRLLLATALLASCGEEPPGAMALHDTSAARSEFFAHPWPSDDRLIDGADGRRRLDLAGFYDPGTVLGGYLEEIAADPLDGFGTQSAIYFRFDAALDPATLPVDAAASLGRDATVFLVDVTAGSPGEGRRHPVRVRFSASSGFFIGERWLALLPEPGFPLRERTTYTAVVTTRVRAADGGRVRRDPRFAAAAARLDAGRLGLPLAEVAVATTFTTQDATSVMGRLREAVHATAAPVVADLAFKRAYKGYDLYAGTFLSPNFQEGEPPYARQGGRIHTDEGGAPAVVRTEKLRFALTVPQGAMPGDGWPVALYAHGTGGDYESFVDDGSAAAVAAIEAGGETLSRMAMISIDQVLHGPRDPTGSDTELSFFNFYNLPAARDNTKQGALDDYQVVRLVEGMNVAAAPGTKSPIRFDRERIYFVGHSQGGLTGGLFLAHEPAVKAAVLSGAGGNLVKALLDKTEPIDVRAVVTAFLNEDADEWHPMLNLLQTYLESSDPANYGRLYFREPPGIAPRSVFHLMGLVDHYTPISTTKVLALAMGVQPVRPEEEPLEGLPLSGLSWGDAPLEGNVASGAATGALREYRVPLGSSGKQRYDGHFVLFDHPDARRQANAFLGTHAATGTARVVP